MQPLERRVALTLQCPGPVGCKLAQLLRQTVGSFPKRVNGITTQPSSSKAGCRHQSAKHRLPKRCARPMPPAAKGGAARGHGQMTDTAGPTHMKDVMRLRKGGTRHRRQQGGALRPCCSGTREQITQSFRTDPVWPHVAAVPAVRSTRDRGGWWVRVGMGSHAEGDRVSVWDRKVLERTVVAVEQCACH